MLTLQFLPRKFKVATTVPGDNSVDIFTNDIGGCDRGLTRVDCGH